MYAGVPIIAFDNEFNRTTTNGMAMFFSNIKELQAHLHNIDTQNQNTIGKSLKEYAVNNYSWENVAHKLTELISIHNVDKLKD